MRQLKRLENGSRLFDAEVPIDELDRYCVDGEQFTSVSIVYPSEVLGNHTVLLIRQALIQQMMRIVWLQNRHFILLM